MTPAPRASDLKRRAIKAKRRGDPMAAVELLDSALRLAAAELADAHGQRAGALRAAGHWGAALADYDAGSRLEQAYATGSSYNQLNRLVCRLIQPTPLPAEPPRPAPDLAAELAALQARLSQQLAHHLALAAAPPSAWALGDLALVAALRDDTRTLARTLQALQAHADRAQVVPAYRQTLDDLCQAHPAESRGCRALRRALGG